MSVRLRQWARRAALPAVRPGDARQPPRQNHQPVRLANGRRLAEEREAFLAASLLDDGGEADVPTRRRSLHVYRARLHIHIEQLSSAVEQLGLFDRRGHLRVAWLQRLEGLIARAQALDATLGLARRSRRLPTLAEYLDQRPESEEP